MFELDRLQAEYLRTSEPSHRRASGQFFTPRWIARGMASWVIAKNPARIVDPAFGLGILLDECARQGYGGKLAGYELDPELVRRWRVAFGNVSAVDLQALDFLESGGAPIEAAIANPPYRSFAHRDLQEGVGLELKSILGQAASGFTNLYALFLYLVISRLSVQGRAAFIVPTEFLATGYGAQVKRFLQTSGRLRHLVIFDSASRIFEQAATTACVLLFDSCICTELNVWRLAGEAESERFDRICGDLEPAASAARMAWRDLEPERNWQGLGRTATDTDGWVPLGTFGAIKRGLATGSNEFFVLPPSRASKLELDPGELVPCIARAGSATGRLFTDAHWSVLQAGDQPCYLFDGCTTPSAAGRGYIHSGELRSVHQRYLTRMRKPWFRLERRLAAPLLLAVFGRRQFRAILNRSRAVHLTAFHGFYPGTGQEHLVALIWLYLQTPTALATCVDQQRAYGDGLNKLEPGDWSKLCVPDWHRWGPESLDQGRKLADETASRLAADPSHPINDAVDQMEQLVRDNRHAARKPGAVQTGAPASHPCHVTAAECGY